jgi:hypothetical protein
MSRGAVPLPTISEESSLPISHKRSHEAIVADREHPLPLGMPTGPWLGGSIEEGKKLAKRDIDEWAYQHPQGRFKTTIYTSNPATKKSGEKITLRCSLHYVVKPGQGMKRRRGGQGTKCEWGVILEDSKEGWVASRPVQTNGVPCWHNHPLACNKGGTLAHASLRCIPEGLIDVADMLKIAGHTPSMIFR